MSDIDDIEDDVELDDEPEEKTATLPRGQLRGLEKKAKRAEKAEAELAALKRDAAFSKAGIDTASPIGKLFTEAYSGDLEAEAISAAWAEVSGVTSDSQPSAAEAASTDERAALASNAATDSGTEPRKPVRGQDGEAVRAGREARDEYGAPMDDAAGVVFNTLVGAAMDGDESVIWKPAEG